jgi:hypothetical protein
VGPPWSQRENGFIIREKCEKGVSVYYEPHASFDGSDLARADDVDMVISPAAEIKMLGYPLVNGFDETRKLLKLLRPKVLMPLANGAIDQGGLIASAVVQTGSLVRRIPPLHGDVSGGAPSCFCWEPPGSTAAHQRWNGESEPRTEQSLTERLHFRRLPWRGTWPRVALTSSFSVRPPSARSS